MTAKTPSRVTHFSIEDFEAVKSEIDAQSDRGAAIIAGSLLDEHMRLAIESRFIRIDADTGRSIFEGLGPLSSFEARRRVGFALGLFDREARNELRIIGQIRNRFAHTIEPIGFEDQEIAKKIAELAYPRLHADTLGAAASHREKYLHSCWVLRAIVTSQLTSADDRPDGPSHEHLLVALAESLAGSLPPDKSRAPHPSHHRNEDPKEAGS